LFALSIESPENVLEKIKDEWNFIQTESMGFAYLLDSRHEGGLQAYVQRNAVVL
jgi:hypothetical protein